MTQTITRIGLLATLLLAALRAVAANVVWFDGRHPITYSISAEAEPVLLNALAMFKQDMKQVTGFEPVEARKPRIRIAQQEGTDDGFTITVSHGTITVEGHGGRGTAYGLLELSRMAGVSPWVWWGDVVPERKDRLTIDANFHLSHTPSVAFRGIFLNDEDWSLRPWSHNNYAPAPKGYIGKETYRRIFQLLLRLRANAIWPAMHTGTTAFFRVEGAKAVADSFGIVIGTSHCEPLLRNNVDEWDVNVRGNFNYRDNREAVQQYWAERLEEVKASSGNMFTIGMRGIHDGSMEGYKTMQEKREGLQQVIDDQQLMLSRYFGDASRLPQVFVPYKEVLQIYERGLRVPDYVTLMWCDDNYGYMTRLSNREEQMRAGGGGIYYHLSYWGRPHDYLWLTTTQPGLIYNEMRRAYDHNVRRLWIVNVHDPKVPGYDLELFLDMAWDIDCVSPTTLHQHYQRWLSRQFGPAAAEAIWPAMHQFYRLCAQRRPEFMGWTQVELDKAKYHRGLSPVTTTEMTPTDAHRYLASYDRIRQSVTEAQALVPARLHDAYFAAVTYPVSAAAAMAHKILGDSLDSRRAYEEIQRLTAQYNALAGGKWRGMMDANPRDLPVFGNVRARLQTDTLSAAPLIARNASAYDEATQGAQPIQMLGHSMSAVSLPAGGTLTYRFSVSAAGSYRLLTALIPTQPADGADMRYSISIDGATPVTYSLKEPFRSERWKLNVLRGQALRSEQLSLAAGSHTLTITAIDEGIVVDQWMLDASPARPFYLIPAEETIYQ